jgi:hypothetical protein
MLLVVVNGREHVLEDKLAEREVTYEELSRLAFPEITAPRFVAPWFRITAEHPSGKLRVVYPGERMQVTNGWVFHVFNVSLPRVA